ncbi:AAA-like domain-containing protein [Nodularia sphaerocarpa]|uniref:AAA-like domain-containing protein n=1 Tax=Nodularia sphaerocarpa TaxID=137816 RepID=UPI001EFB6788|nr:AAA-like domain-containing protein [Nodularia sphaerocarpa]MDB9374082.1 AAA-like domain-containing protein [Nodularia sphaerocarpa CS-585]ULP71430.1 hypothetical protein BDGGKGIB_01056 [Nodularia sphaerocarpa UHCC 0038]
MLNTVSKSSNHEIKSLEALKTIRAILSPRHLTYIEEIVFVYTWDGKLYREMSHETGYKEGYLKDIGSRLWLSLSQKLGHKVTKKSLKLLIANFCADKSLATTRYSRFNRTASKIEFPGSPLSFGSPLYIDRSPMEDLAIAALHQPGSLIRIKAPQRMGKTSLINHLMGVADQAGMQTVFVDIRQADTKTLEDLDQFLRWFCLTIGQQLNLDTKFDKYWFESACSKLSCTTYMQECFLRPLERPLVVAIDTAHSLVEHPHIAKNFFSMLRSWYEQAKVRDHWQKLRLIVAHVAELDPFNQSAFNLGLPLNLSWLTTHQIKDLAQRYELHKVGINNFYTLQPLQNLVGGHPYLLHLAFYWLRSGYLSLPKLLHEAATDRGIYGDYLRCLCLVLQQDDTLMAAFHQLLLTPNPIRLSAKTAERLEGIGLVQIQGVKSSLGCELYRQYFCAHLELQHG